MAPARNDLPQYSPSPLPPQDTAMSAPSGPCPRCGDHDTRLLPMSRTPDWSRCVTCGHVWTAAMLRSHTPASRDGSPPAIAEEVAEVLFWSKRGEVACELHAPPQDSEQWGREHWTHVTTHRRLRYQCQHCHEDVPIARRHRQNR